MNSNYNGAVLNVDILYTVHPLYGQAKKDKVHSAVSAVLNKQHAPARSGSTKILKLLN